MSCSRIKQSPSKTQVFLLSSTHPRSKYNWLLKKICDYCLKHKYWMYPRFGYYRHGFKKMRCFDERLSQNRKGLLWIQTNSSGLNNAVAVGEIRTYEILKYRYWNTWIRSYCNASRLCARSIKCYLIFTYFLISYLRVLWNMPYLQDMTMFMLFASNNGL
jgi:hypothetical protein